MYIGGLLNGASHDLLPLQVRRLMEEENQKKRKAARRAYNDTVRELTAFVRKRDKRVAAHQVCASQGLL